MQPEVETVLWSMLCAALVAWAMLFALINRPRMSKPKVYTWRVVLNQFPYGESEVIVQASYRHDALFMGLDKLADMGVYDRENAFIAEAVRL